MATPDQIAAEKIKKWLVSRDSARTAWKKTANLAAAFGAKRLTSMVRQRITDALAGVGIELEPALDTLGPNDTVNLHLESDQGAFSSELGEATGYSEFLPNQIIAWDASNIAEDAGLNESGEWLRCLKATQAGDRQFIWESSSKRGIIGMVTYSGILRNEGAIEGWGIYMGLENPVSREELLAHPATAERFGPRGIRALQGSAIRLTGSEAEAIVEMLGGLAPTALPWDEPDQQAEVIPWTSIKGLPAEKFIEIAICKNRSLWRSLGLSRQPKQQVTWSSVGRVDLICGNTVIEAKKAVTVDNGPAQIERYLRHLAKQLHTGPNGVRGILVQKNDWAVPMVRERLEASPYPLELWSIDKDEDGDWRAVHVC